MQAFVNPYASDAIQRVPLTYENMSMLQRECDVTAEEYEALLVFCGWCLSLLILHYSDFTLPCTFCPSTKLALKSLSPMTLPIK
jgi:hypothetical protein